MGLEIGLKLSDGGSAASTSSATGEFEASFESGSSMVSTGRDTGILSGNATWHSIAWKGERIQQHILVNNDVPSDSQLLPWCPVT